MLTVPETALQFGFLNNPVGTHGSRTIMLKELQLLLTTCPLHTMYDQFRTAVVDTNVLLKNTTSTRKESFRRLRELYAIDEGVLLFRALRDLWDEDEEAQPLIAILCASARDSILRASAKLILSTPQEHQVTPQMIEKVTEESFPNRYNPTMLANVGRHAASSWQQSGHLRGRLKKIRDQADSRPTAVAYALMLGHICGERGDNLFRTLWAQLLDAPEHTLRDQAQQASRLGYLEYRHAGTITEISFHHLLRSEKEEMNHE